MCVKSIHYLFENTDEEEEFELYPCGHMCCSKCAEESKRNNKCILCLEEVKEIKNKYKIK